MAEAAELKLVATVPEHVVAGSFTAACEALARQAGVERPVHLQETPAYGIRIGAVEFTRRIDEHITARYRLSPSLNTHDGDHLYARIEVESDDLSVLGKTPRSLQWYADGLASGFAGLVERATREWEIARRQQGPRQIGAI